MMRDSEEGAPASGFSDPAGAQEVAGEAPQSGTAPDLRQKKGREGSYNYDDPERDRWDYETALEAEYMYRHENGTYAYSKLKGRRKDGEKTFLTGQGFVGRSNDLQIEKRESPREFFAFPGIEYYKRGTGDQPDLLYRVDELVREMADRPADPVFITEGEKDADTLWDLGLIATTNPNGALKWNAKFNSRFRDRNVVVLLDNNPKGSDAAIC